MFVSYKEKIKIKIDIDIDIKIENVRSILVLVLLHSPNPLESEVFLSTNTLAEITFPKGANSVAKSASVKSLGRW